MESSGLILFLPGVFHFFGGIAFGRGLRDKTFNLILWGIVMGGTALVFDWFFFLRLGQLVNGLIGPGIFIIASIISYFLLTAERMNIHEKSIGLILMGSVTLLFGILLAPFLLKQASSLQADLGAADYIFGGCLLILPFLVGISFISGAIQAMRKKQSFDQLSDEREMEIEEAADKRKGRKKNS